MADKLDIIDVNTWLGSWPFDYYREDTAAKLDSLLASEGVSLAFVSTPEASLNPDYVEANRRLFRRVRRYDRLRAVVTLDPTIGGWRDALAEAGESDIAVVRIMPGYHDYRCNSAEAAALVEELDAGDGVLMVQVRMADERTHHSLCQIPATPAEDIIEFAGRHPGLPVVAICAYINEAAEIAKSAPNVSFDISHIEKMRTVPSLLERVPADRVLFGSHAPFLTLRSAKMKLTAPGVSEADRRNIASGNARRIFGLAGSEEA
jgi:predicted TIM-barrel fold metal-dependent hydrolase